MSKVKQSSQGNVPITVTYINVDGLGLENNNEELPCHLTIRTFFLLYSQQPTHITYCSQTNPVHIIPYSVAALIPISTPAKWRLLSKFSD
jgi:hypothetical protein